MKGGAGRGARGRVASPLAHDKGYYHSYLGRSRKGTFRPYQPPEPQKFSGPLGNPPSHHEKVAV